MSAAELTKFCGVFQYVYVEDTVVDGIPGCWFIDFVCNRKWIAETEIKNRLMSSCSPR